MADLIRLGDEGGQVRRWQRLLLEKGFVLALDGVFGPKTLSATLVAQAWSGVDADGIVGPLTWAAVSAKSRSPRPVSTVRNVLRPPGVAPRILDVRKGQHGFVRHPSRTWGLRTSGVLDMGCGHYTGGPGSFQADARFHVESSYLTAGGAPAIAYTLGVDKDGTLFVFNHWTSVTWHCDGGQNTRKLGLVFRGGAEGPNLAQRRTLTWVIRQLAAGTFRPVKGESAWPKLDVLTTHRHVRATSCPGEIGERFYRAAAAKFTAAP